MGFARGQLIGTELTAFVNGAWNFIKSQVVQGLMQDSFPKWLAELIALIGLDAALDATELVTRLYTDQAVFDELAGIAAASPGLSYSRLYKLHMVAGLTQGKCSLFVANASATLNGHLLQLRALDWSMDEHFLAGKAVAVYHPSAANANAYVNVGFVGLIGALTGVNEAMIGISEIGVSYPDATFGEESRIGVPFIFLLRDILMYDRTVDEAVARLKSARRTCDLLLGVAGGKQGYGYAFEYSYSTLDVFDPTNMRPDNSTWHFKLQDIVYFGMDFLCPGFNEVLGTQLKKNHGKLTAELTIRDVVSVEASGDTHAAVYDLTAGELFVSFGSSQNATKGLPQAAYGRQFTKFNLHSLFNETLH